MVGRDSVEPTNRRTAPAFQFGIFHLNLGFVWSLGVGIWDFRGAAAWDFCALARAFDLAVAVPIQGRERGFILVQSQARYLRQGRIPLRCRSLRAQLIFQRSLLHKLDRSILKRVVCNGPAKHQTL